MQNRFLAMLICCFIIANSCAQVAANKIMVTVKNGQFTIGRVNVTKDWTLYPLLQVLEKKNDRKRAGYNTTHSFDKYGIVLFEKNDSQQLPTDTISEAQFYYAIRDSNAVTPRENFTGVLQIEDYKFTGNETPQKVKEVLKLYRVTDSYMEHNIRLAYKGLYIFFLFTDDEDKLLKISIGKDNRKY